MLKYCYIQNISESFEAHKTAANCPHHQTVYINEFEDENLGIRYIYISFADISEGIHFALNYGLDLPGYVSGESNDIQSDWL